MAPTEPVPAYAPDETYVNDDRGIVCLWRHDDGSSTMTETYPDGEVIVRHKADAFATWGRPQMFRLAVA